MHQHFEQTSGKSHTSPQQRRLWHLQETAGRDAVWRTQGLVRIDGSLEVDRLDRALATVVGRHEILRTSLSAAADSGVPFQLTRDSAAPTLVQHDRIGRALDQDSDAVEDLLRDLGAAPFDCHEASVRFALVTFSDVAHALLVSQPASCGDTASLANLVREIASAYADDRASASTETPPLQYAELAAWQNQILESEDAAEGIARWQRQNPATDDDVALPHEIAPRHDGDFLRDCVDRVVPTPLHRAIGQLCAQYRVTPESFYLAGWVATLARLTGREEILVGVGSAGRQGEDLMTALGPLHKSLPTALRCATDGSFADLLRGVEEATAAGREWHDFYAPSDDAAETTARTPALAFDYQEPVSVFGNDEVSFAIHRRDHYADRFKLRLSCSEDGGLLRTRFDYDADRSSSDGVRCLARQYHALLHSACEDSSQPIRALQMTDDDQRHQMLVEFNDTDHPLPADTCIHDLIERQASATPDAIAVLFGDHELSYRELDSRANQLAHWLQRHGVGPNVFVGIHVDPSLEMVVGLLGVLKAGGAYVPLDPEFPPDRLAFMLQDTGAPVLLTQQNLSTIPTGDGIHVLRLDGDWARVETENNQLPTANRLPTQLAYAIYTSGSTGKPKGVPITHENLVHSTLARITYYGGQVGRYLLLSSFGFDSSVAGIFWTLIDGGALVLPQAGTQRDPDAINDLMRRHRVTHSLCLASHYARIMSGGSTDSFASLETAIVSGEVFSSALVERHDALAPGARLFNEYGPTEGSVWSIVFDCHDPVAGNRVPIGKPISNTQIYLLDAAMQPVPLGLPGEIHQGGVGVAQGYLNRPELTAERFVPDPFRPAPGARLYKSGDLARYLPDGNIEFLGRMDDQVKLRGYRIELGEIDAVLGQHPAVHEVAVVCQQDPHGEPRLVAYLAFKNSPGPSTSALRAYLGEKLPAYMIPAVFVVMETLPRTSIGKLDTAALPAPDSARPDLQDEFVPPRTPIEEVLAGIWESALDVERVGIHDNFFELGGHSLLAIRITHMVSETLATQLPLRTVFDQPTVAGLAAVLEADPANRERITSTARTTLQIAALSDDEVETLLAKELQADELQANDSTLTQS